MTNIAAKTGGVMIFDFCQFNIKTFFSDGWLDRAAAPFPGCTVTAIDSQTWYAAELPNPLPGT